MTILKKTICAVLAAATLGGSVVGSTATAEARGGAFAAGIIGGVALGAIGARPRADENYVAERRYVRRPAAAASSTTTSIAEVSAEARDGSRACPSF